MKTNIIIISAILITLLFTYKGIDLINKQVTQIKELTDRAESAEFNFGLCKFLLSRGQ